MELSHLIPGYQFRFRPDHSPIHQAHRVVNEIVSSLEERALCTAVFLDVAQAFDKVWNIGLLYKLNASLPGSYYLLLQSYLTDRYFQVRYNGVCSDCNEVRSGVPQGSVLGPLPIYPRLTTPPSRLLRTTQGSWQCIMILPSHPSACRAT